MNPLENTQANFFVLCAEARNRGQSASDICTIMSVKPNTFRRYDTTGYLLITEQDKLNNLTQEKWSVHYKAFRKLFDFCYPIQS